MVHEDNLIPAEYVHELGTVGYEDERWADTGFLFCGGEKMTKQKCFPGYYFVPKLESEDNKDHNMYRETDLGMGGYVYAEPGMYGNVALLDVQSLHPSSIRNMNCFGEYTKNFNDLLDIRVAIKHKEYDKARSMMNGKLAKYLDDETTAKELAQALKISINSCYGLTSANFSNPFRDERNVNNIVALRGALFMRTLQDEVQKRGFKVAHIKTDSIKIPDANPEIIKFCMDFAAIYGYIFEHEATYERMCLVNNAVYIAKYASQEFCENTYGYCPGDNYGHGGNWTATGAEFQHPYIFKTLFSHEELEFKDFCETKAVSKGEIYMDFNESLPDGEHNMQFVGKVGSFVPVKIGAGGGILYRVADGKNFAVTGTKLAKDHPNRDLYFKDSKGDHYFRWIEAELFDESMLEDIDMSYFEKLANDAMRSIVAYGDYEWFVSDRPYVGPEYIQGDEMPYPGYLPWKEY